MAKHERTILQGRKITSFVPVRGAAARGGRFYNAVKSIDGWLATHPAARLLAIVVGAVTVIATLFTLYAANVQLKEMAAERDFRNQERIDRDRQFLFTRAGGDTGKALVFNRLFVEELIGPSIDLSCRNIGILAEGTCESRPAFSGIELIGPTEGWGDDYADYAFNLNFSSADFDGARIDRAELLVDIGMARFGFSRIERSSLAGRFDGAHFIRSSLAGSLLQGSFAGSLFEGVNISGLAIVVDEPTFPTKVDAPITCSDTEFAVVVEEPGQQACMARQAFPEMFEAWFWADRPPVFYPDWQVYGPEWMRPVICDPRGLPDPATEGDVFDRQHGFCEPMSMATAMLLYPLRWNPDVRCTDRYDLAYLKTDRTAPPTPCTVSTDEEADG